MDVDPPAVEAESTVEFHAVRPKIHHARFAPDFSPSRIHSLPCRLFLSQLAIVHMSDQYTRISCGGSPLSKDAPVVGLLFGNRNAESKALEILDADDIPTEISDATKQQIALHQAVFPQHDVVGWYRVSVDNHPTARDVQLTQTMKQHFSPDGGRFVFSLLQVKSESEALPLSLYELDASGSVLIGTENWQLETSEPERIGVERVVREETRTKKESQQESSYATQVTSIQQSLQAMNERLIVLITYLEQTQKGEIPVNSELLRKVKALLCQLGPLMASSPTKENAPMLLSHMAIVAKTVRAVQSYTEKFRSLYESRSAREQRRY